MDQIKFIGYIIQTCIAFVYFFFNLLLWFW